MESDPAPSTPSGTWSRPVEPPMTLLVMAGAWVAGVFLAAHTSPVGAAPWLFVLSALLAAVALKLGRRSARPAVFAALLLLGLFRADGAESPSPLAPYRDTGPVEVRGLVAEDAESAGTASRFRLRVESVSRGGDRSQVSDDILVTARAPLELLESRDRPYFRYGDRGPARRGARSPAGAGRLRLPRLPRPSGYRVGNVVPGGIADRGGPGLALHPDAPRDSAASGGLPG